MAINRYSTPVQNTLEQYVPIPFQEMMAAGQSIQQRGDAAELSAAQTAAGLASIEALAPAHKQFVTQFASNYNKDINDLMGKYNNNPSDPLFKRDLNRLNLKYTGDPRLKTVVEANSQLKRNQELAARMAAEGKLFINPDFTGADPSGNLISNVGSVRGVNTLDAWNNRLKIAHQSMIDDGRGNSSNIRNLKRAGNQILSSIQNGSPETIDLINAYKSQGMTDSQAQQQAIVDANRLIGEYGERREHNYSWDSLQFQKARAAKEDAAQGPVPFNIQSFDKPITDNKGESNLAAVKSVDSALKRLDSKGNLTRIKPIKNEFIMGAPNMGTPNMGTPSISDDAKLLTHARNMLGIRGGTAKEVFTRYKELIKKYDQVASSVMSTDNVELNENMADLVRRQIGTGQVFELKNGVPTKVTDEESLLELSDIKANNISGISARSNPITEGGYTMFSNKGKTYMTPLSTETNSTFKGSQAIDNFVTDFSSDNLREIKLNKNGVSTKVWIDPTKSIAYPIAQDPGAVLTPYKVNQNGGMVGGGIITYSNGKTQSLTLGQLQKLEFNSVGINTLNNNK